MNILESTLHQNNYAENMKRALTPRKPKTDQQHFTQRKNEYLPGY